jgi:hypothetical protein
MAAMLVLSSILLAACAAHGLLEETTDDCSMKGVHNNVTKGLIKEELVMSFLPGAFV